ncbi:MULTISPECIES: hypothetical protein [unclassified Pseudoclavibacter]|jgi:hypothetical protein|uniref:hypothetical protein n=1 Tax=unclassified Pseudoclavibacter TaxID=2615177 RepID=UPI000CE758DB|nr:MULTISPECIES: hypothetical protein [unclassified Pseudoclavibacter]MBS3178394.1 hypothetical protein [Pseudoclavibacter sp. Marseille-Q4354]NYF14092.1 modulator of FtsH protease [Pseudoclavibacter sp. JAI123]PPG28980.1 hypothetical protein C5B97_08005 [Pseudoclavibacter sp. RFBB5]
MSVDAWESFFVATVGAGAALAGLIIVAMSVNVAMIIKIKSMPSRAGATIASLLLIVIVGAAGLIPGISNMAFGGVTLAVTLVVAALYWRTSVIGFRNPNGHLREHILRVAFTVLQLLPMLIGGVLAFGTWEALSWVAAGFLLTFAGATLNAWVLLVEILR